ncbi:MAG: sulfurtransferase TusA family protein [Thermodesulfovibrionales bacterium]|nr:sulfurtransferase TusA family protein [Thermodesulfovibrionales bacterium]
MGELSSQTPVQTLDVLGRVCPYPLVLTKKAVEKLSSGQILKVLCDAPASAEDTLPRWAEKQGLKFEAVKLEDKWEIYIQKP